MCRRIPALLGPDQLPVRRQLDEVFRSPGYVLRSIDRFPKQGPAPPWRGYQSYPRDLRYIGRAELEDGVLRFERDGVPANVTSPAAVA